MQRFILKNLFWILQFLGWGAFSLFLVETANLSEKWQGTLIITIGNMLVFIAMTSVLRWSLNKFAPIENFKPIDLFKVFIAVLITALLLPTVAYYVGVGSGKILRFLFEDSKDFFNKPPTETNSYGKYIVYTVIISGWTVFFYIIKLIRKSNNERIQRLRLKDQVKQAQLNTLKGHINPNFIFSSLNSIKGLMLEDVPKSRAMLTTLSEMLRYSLIKNDINGVLLEEELEVSKNYISLFTIEESRKFNVNYNIAPETLSLLIPPLLFPNLIELATRFGMFEAKNEDSITVTSEIKNNNLKISVAHTSNMTVSNARQSLENMLKQRLKLLYGDNASYMTNHEVNNYTLWVTLPVHPFKSLNS